MIICVAARSTNCLKAAVSSAFESDKFSVFISMIKSNEFLPKLYKRENNQEKGESSITRVTKA
jgi:hypothetical protein